MRQNRNVIVSILVVLLLSSMVLSGAKADHRDKETTVSLEVEAKEYEEAWFVLVPRDIDLPHIPEVSIHRHEVNEHSHLLLVLLR